MRPRKCCSKSPLPMMVASPIAVLFIILLLSLLPGSSSASLSTCDILFLQDKDAAAVLTSERSEPYFSKLNRVEIEAKTGGRIKAQNIHEARLQTRKLYARSVIPFTPDEKHFLTTLIGHVCTTLKTEFDGIVLRPWKLIKTESFIEGGLPYTREDAIIFSAGQLDQMMGRHAGYGEMILAHEILHVVQRENRRTFTDFYRRQWGYRFVGQIAGVPAALQEQQVINPDGVNFNWILPDRSGGKRAWIWPRIVFAQNGRQPAVMPEDFRFLAVKLRQTEEGYRVVRGQEDLSGITSMAEDTTLRQQFPSITIPYHPDEVAADYFGRFYIATRYGEQIKVRAGDDRAFKQLIAMLKSEF